MSDLANVNITMAKCNLQTAIKTNILGRTPEFNQTPQTLELSNALPVKKAD